MSLVVDTQGFLCPLFIRDRSANEKNLCSYKQDIEESLMNKSQHDGRLIT